jgi:hypothetical protein
MRHPGSRGGQEFRPKLAPVDRPQPSRHPLARVHPPPRHLLLVREVLGRRVLPAGTKPGARGHLVAPGSSARSSPIAIRTKCSVHARQ